MARSCDGNVASCEVGRQLQRLERRSDPSSSVQEWWSGVPGEEMTEQGGPGRFYKGTKSQASPGNPCVTMPKKKEEEKRNSVTRSL